MRFDQLLRVTLLLVTVLSLGVPAGAVDGPFDALLIGAPLEDSTISNVGVVHWLWGDMSGLTDAGNDLRFGDSNAWNLGVSWGLALASGDVNGDGRADLVVGAPLAFPGDPILFGTGLVSVCLRDADPPGAIWTCSDLSQGAGGLPGIPEPGDYFGAAVAVDDFDNDGFDDVAIGAPRENSSEGAVHVVYGSSAGITADGNQLLIQGSGGVAGLAEAEDQFGFAFATGDFDGDGFADLAVGVPGENDSAGAIHMFYGSGAGLGTGDDGVWTQTHFVGAAQDEPGDKLGYSLAAGDFDDDGYDDLLCGLPYEDWTAAEQGMIIEILGGPDGIGSWSAAGATWPAGSSPEDLFGWVVACGDFDGDGTDDWAVGMPGDDTDATNAGSVWVYSSTSGWSQWRQGPIGGEPEPDDYFGEELVTGDFDGDGWDDLTVGVPAEDVGTVVDAGAVNVIYGSAVGLTTAGAQLWHQDAGTVAGGAEADDWFGYALAVLESHAIFTDDLESGNLDRWSAVVP